MNPKPFRRSYLPATFIVCALPILAFADDGPRVVLGGEVGNAATACVSLPSIRCHG